jgi:hypothetical protein
VTPEHLKGKLRKLQFESTFKLSVLNVAKWVISAQNSTEEQPELRTLIDSQKHLALIFDKPLTDRHFLLKLSYLE